MAVTLFKVNILNIYRLNKLSFIHNKTLQIWDPWKDYDHCVSCVPSEKLHKLRELLLNIGVQLQRNSSKGLHPRFQSREVQQPPKSQLPLAPLPQRLLEKQQQNRAEAKYALGAEEDEDKGAFELDSPRQSLDSPSPKPQQKRVTWKKDNYERHKRISIAAQRQAVQVEDKEGEEGSNGVSAAESTNAEPSPTSTPDTPPPPPGVPPSEAAPPPPPVEVSQTPPPTPEVTSPPPPPPPEATPPPPPPPVRYVVDSYSLIFDPPVNPNFLQVIPVEGHCCLPSLLSTSLN